MKKSIHFKNRFRWTGIAFGPIAAILMLYSCQKQSDSVPDPITSMNQLVVDSHFNWATTHDVTFSISAKDNEDSPIPGVRFTLYTSDPDSGGVYLVSGITGEDGLWNRTVSLPTAMTKVTVFNNFIGLIRQMELPIVGEAVTGKFGGKPPVAKEKKSSVTIGGGEIKSVNSVKWVYMSGYNSMGVPHNLMSTNDPVTQQLLQDLNNAFPEWRNEIPLHPEWFTPGVTNNLDIQSESDVYITYITEGAGWMNSLAYFTFNTNQPPASAAQIDTMHVIFPNFSNDGSGGGLYPGNKIYLGKFPAGKSIGLAVVPHGWNGNGTYVGPGSDVWYSIPSFNTNDPGMLKHLLLFNDPSRQQVLFTLEDMGFYQGADRDFNDNICYITVNPISGVNTANMPIVATTVTDSDHDGVPDNSDDYPMDPTKAFNNFTPSKTGTSTLAFEDQWPVQGDYDFNDVVLSYRFNQVTNAQNKVAEIDATLVVDAIGALYHSGFGFQLPVTPDKILNVTGTSLKHGLINLSANNTEAGQSKAVIIAFDDAFDHLKAAPGLTFANTVPGDPFTIPDTLHLVITLTSPVLLSQMGSPPYNPFIFVDRNRNREVHLTNNPPTDKVDGSDFGTGNDNSNPAQGRYYETSNNLPWALNIADHFDYPVENKAINNGFLKFNNWAMSSGAQYNDWYKNFQGYRQASLIYAH